jgi:hypothetical protein
MRSASQIATDVLTKIAREDFDAYGNLIPPDFPVASTAMGAGIGGLAAHLMPTQRAKDLREMAANVPMDAKSVTGDFADGLEKTRFKSIPAVVKKFYLDQALRANALRMVGGVGAGAVGGYALSRLLGDE